MSKLIFDATDNINVHYFEKFLNKRDANKFFNLMEKDYKNGKFNYYSKNESQIVFFGKKIDIPRKQVSYGDGEITYTFSGLTIKSRDWNEKSEICEYIRKFKDYVNSVFGKEYNFVLINRYEDGNSYIGAHSDDEKDLGDNPDIAGISFGATREMVFTSKEKTKNISDKVSVKLNHNSAYIMYSPTNKYWKHEIKKSKIINTPRISLTFRKMM